MSFLSGLSDFLVGSEDDNYAADFEKGRAYASLDDSYSGTPAVYSTAQESLDKLAGFRRANMSIGTKYKPVYEESFKKGFEHGAREFKKRLADEYERDLENHSLSCNRCSALAYPVADTQRHYCCSGCGHKFTAANHPF